MGIALRIISGIFVLLLIITALGGWVVVDEGERGVYTRFGEVRGTVDPGFHFKIPFVDSVTTYEVRTQAYTMSETAGEGDVNRDDAIDALTNEGLNVRIDMTVRYHINPSEVGEIYTSVGRSERQVVERIVRPTSREAVRSCSAQYSVEGIYSDQRDDFSNCVEGNINDDFSEKGLVMETVQVRNIMLPQKVRTAIQEKQTAQERIEKKQKELEIAKLEKKRKIIEAGGIAESNQIIGESLSRQYLKWYWIQEGLEKGDAIYVPIGDDGLPIYKDVDSVNQTASP